MWIIWAIIVGLIAGFLARAIVPGDNAMSVGATLVLGLVGSLVGGFLGWVLFGRDAADGAFQTSGLIGSLIGAVVALLVWRSVGSRSRGGLTT